MFDSLCAVNHVHGIHGTLLVRAWVSPKGLWCLLPLRVCVSVCLRTYMCNGLLGFPQGSILPQLLISRTDWTTTKPSIYTVPINRYSTTTHYINTTSFLRPALLFSQPTPTYTYSVKAYSVQVSSVTHVHACRCRLPGNKWQVKSVCMMAGNECSLGSDLRSGIWSDGWLRTSTYTAAAQIMRMSGSGAETWAIIMKKCFIPESNFPPCPCPCPCSYEGKRCAWTSVGYRCGPFMHMLP